ncbi:MAG: hypothetical protein KKA75_03045 [Proteobacteria bacterium]|nr:hypothetical protein [Pseudomonadota bacterium]
MKLIRKKPTIKQVLTTCSWCGFKIGNYGPIYSIGCKKRPGVNISKYEGRIMPVKMATLGKIIWAIVPIAESDARRSGNDFFFTLCSEDCGNQLKEALGLEKEIGELIFSAEHIC